MTSSASSYRRISLAYLALITLIGYAASLTIAMVLRQKNTSFVEERFQSIASVNAHSVYRALRVQNELLIALGNSRSEATALGILEAVKPRYPMMGKARILGAADSVAGIAIEYDTPIAAVVSRESFSIVAPITSASALSVEYNASGLLEFALSNYDTNVATALYDEGGFIESGILPGAHYATRGDTTEARSWSGEFQLAGKNWKIRCWPTAKFLEESRSHSPLVAILIGFVGSTLAGIKLSRVFLRVRIAEDERRALLDSMRRELAIARELQKTMLPREAPSVAGLSIGIAFYPSGEVGGDFFLLEPDENGTLDVVLSDITGHGVPAALVFAIFKTLLHDVRREKLPLAEEMRELNRRSAKSFPDGHFASTFAARLSPAGRTLKYVKASQEPALHFRNGKRIEVLSEGGALIGAFDPDLFGEPEYKEGNVTLERGDLIFFYTDGLVEVESPAGELLGMERLSSWIEEGTDLAPQVLLDTLYRRVLEYGGQGSLRDDFTALAVRIEK